MATALDSLKEIFWITRDHYVFATENLVANEVLDDDHPVLGAVDSMMEVATTRLAKYVPGLRWDVYPRIALEAQDALVRYDDGSLVRERIEIREGVFAYYYPRVDGDFDEWKLQFFPHLRAVVSDA